MMEKKRIASEKRAARISEKNAIELNEKIRKWRSGDHVSLGYLPNPLLRINGAAVETSSGARVSLDAARNLLATIESGKAKTGMQIDGYTFNSFDGETITIGCHRILINEARSVLK